MVHNSGTFRLNVDIQQWFTYMKSRLPVIKLKMLLALARTLRTKEVHVLHIAAWKQNNRASAHIPEALQYRGNPISTLNVLWN